MLDFNKLQPKFTAPPKPWTKHINIISNSDTTSNAVSLNSKSSSKPSIYTKSNTISDQFVPMESSTSSQFIQPMSFLSHIDDHAINHQPTTQEFSIPQELLVNPIRSTTNGDKAALNDVNTNTLAYPTGNPKSLVHNPPISTIYPTPPLLTSGTMYPSYHTNHSYPTQLGHGNIYGPYTGGYGMYQDGRTVFSQTTEALNRFSQILDMNTWFLDQLCDVIQGIMNRMHTIQDSLNWLPESISASRCYTMKKFIQWINILDVLAPPPLLNDICHSEQTMSSELNEGYNIHGPPNLLKNDKLLQHKFVSKPVHVQVPRQSWTTYIQDAIKRLRFSIMLCICVFLFGVWRTFRIWKSIRIKHYRI